MHRPSKYYTKCRKHSSILWRLRLQGCVVFLCRGEDSEALEIQSRIEELEEKAEGLDKMRTSTISSISYINDRNRKRNVEEAEKAIMVSL